MGLPSRWWSLLAVGVLALGGGKAEAHWCHDLWGSSYNIVVRPAADTVNVPGGGSATLDVYVQNNMGYPLKSFVLTAQATGYTISVSRQAPKVTGFLMPGESLRHTLTISAGSAGTLSVQALDFLVNFGDGSQDQLYGGGGKPTMVKQKSGAIFPARTVPGLNQGGNDQSTHLLSSAAADYGNLGASLDALMTEYCTGRASWDTGGGAPSGTCTPAGATTCPAQANRGHTKYDWQHLWASQELVIRKSALGARAATLRERLKCAWNDTNPAFRWFAAVMLGYLGEDASTRTFLTGLISSGSASADDKLVAKAALLLLRSAADKTSYGADVNGCLGSTGSADADYVQMACAASLAIIDRNDAAVNAELIPRSGWVEPDLTSENGKSLYAAHLINLVAWDRRGWAVDAADTGAVSFYSSAPPDTVAPRAPVTTSCTAQNNGTIRVNWTQVTLDVNGQAENVTGYRVYRGATARPAGAQRPGDLGFDYDHVDPTSSIYFDFPSLPGTAAQYFTVVAVDAAGNASVYGQQVSCTPKYPPVAVISCTPLTGQAPLSVTCNSSGSTDANGTADITTRSFQLAGQAAQVQAQVTYNFTTSSSNLVTLTVTDSTGLTSSASATIVVSTAGNRPPTAMAAATPASGPAPLAVSFSSAGSSDPDSGQTLSFLWDFGDGSATSTQPNPSHTYVNAGSHVATLTVTDNAAPSASATAQVTVVAQGNAPPDLASASVSPRAGAAPLQVGFDASGVTDPDGLALQFAWAFGDGTPDATTAVATHTYATEGAYTATLTVTDPGTPALAPVTANFVITVAPPGTQNRPPDCGAATVTPLQGPAPLTISMDATGCVDPDGNALTYTWRVPTSYTTEETFSTATAQFTLATPGTYTVKLAAVDDAAVAIETNQTFQVVVGTPALEEVVGVCGCNAMSAPSAVLLWALVGLGLRRRRARRP